MGTWNRVHYDLFFLSVDGRMNGGHMFIYIMQGTFLRLYGSQKLGFFKEGTSTAFCGLKGLSFCFAAAASLR